VGTSGREPQAKVVAEAEASESSLWPLWPSAAPSSMFIRLVAARRSRTPSRGCRSWCKRVWRSSLKPGPPARRTRVKWASKWTVLPSGPVGEVTEKGFTDNTRRRFAREPTSRRCTGYQVISYQKSRPPGLSLDSPSTRAMQMRVSLPVCGKARAMGVRAKRRDAGTVTESGLSANQWFKSQSRMSDLKGCCDLLSRIGNSFRAIRPLNQWRAADAYRYANSSIEPGCPGP